MRKEPILILILILSMPLISFNGYIQLKGIKYSNNLKKISILGDSKHQKLNISLLDNYVARRYIKADQDHISDTITRDAINKHSGDNTIENWKFPVVDGIRPMSISGIAPPSSGDWIINDTTIINEEELIINGSIIIKSGGALILKNSVLYMKLSSDGEFKIEALTGSNLTIINSKITAYDPRYNYYIKIDDGALFSLIDSEISYAGYNWGFEGDLSGLWINTDNYTVRGSKFYKNFVGLVAYSCENATIENNLINDSLSMAMYIKSSSNITLLNNIVQGGGNGIRVVSSSNITIANSNITGTYEWGIELENSYNVSIIDSMITQTYYYGLYLVNSENNTIQNNNISYNSYGIFITSNSNNNSLISNLIENNQNHGIHVAVSNNNSLISNDIRNNGGFGVYLEGSRFSVIRNNDFTNDGLFVYNSYDNNVEDNKVNGKPLVYLENEVDITISYAGQVILINSLDILIIAVDCSSADVGIELWRTNSSSIYNSVIKNNIYGIYMYETDDNSVFSSTISGSSDKGIYIYKSDYPYIHNTVFNSNIFGVYASETWLLYIENNSFFNNDVGAALLGTNHSEIKENNFDGNNDGLKLTNSNDNDIINNTVINNKNNGIEIYQSTQNYLVNNTIMNNSYYGIYLHSSDWNDLINNTFIKDGLRVEDSYNNNVDGNTVNNKPLIYLESDLDKTITNAGQVILIQCTDISLSNLDISETDIGIYMEDCSHCGIHGSNVMNNYFQGIFIYISLHIEIEDTYMGNNQIAGIELSQSSQINIQNNIITSINGSSIIIEKSYDIEVSSNNITNNEDSLIISNSTQVFLTANKFESNNQYAVKIYDSNTLQVTANTIVNHDYGIYIENVSDTYVGFNNITGNNVDGVYIYNSSNIDVSNNEIQRNKMHGISVSESKTIHVYTNYIYSSGYGVYLYGCEDIEINWNYFRNNSEAIRLTKTNNSLVFDNTITSNGIGINLVHSSNNVILSNTVWFSNINIWILESDSQSNKIYFNYIAYGEIAGIELDNAYINKIYANTIISNNIGVFSRNSFNNVIFLNDFINNSIHVIDNGLNTYYSTYGDRLYGNYWDNFTGHDLNGDLINDIKYAVNASNNIYDRNSFAVKIEFLNKDLFVARTERKIDRFSLYINTRVITEDTIEDVLIKCAYINVSYVSQATYNPATGTFYTVFNISDLNEWYVYYSVLIRINDTWFKTGDRTIEFSDLTKPEIISVTWSPEKPHVNEEITIYAQVRDNWGIDQVILRYYDSTDNSWNEITMNHFAGTDIYYTDLASFDYSTKLLVTIHAFDTSGNEAVSDIYVIEIKDSPPTIEHISWTPQQPGPYRNITVMATITDDTGISKVILFYYTDSWNNITMVYNEELGVYVADIIGQPAGTKIKIKIYAVDTSGKESISGIYTIEVKSPPSGIIGFEGILITASVAVISILGGLALAFIEPVRKKLFKFS